MTEGDPIDLTLKRLARLEQGQQEANQRLEQMDRRFERLEDSLGRIVLVLEAHDRRLEQIVSRLDRLIEVTLRSKTDDAERMSGIERRLRALEERNPVEPG